MRPFYNTLNDFFTHSTPFIGSSCDGLAAQFRESYGDWLGHLDDSIMGWFLLSSLRYHIINGYKIAISVTITQKTSSIVYILYFCAKQVDDFIKIYPYLMLDTTDVMADHFSPETFDDLVKYSEDV